MSNNIIINTYFRRGVIMKFRLLFVAIIPVMAIALGTFFADRYDREPPLLLLKVFLGGAFIALPVAGVEKFLQTINILPGIFYTLFTAFIIAGLTEEFFKKSVVMFFAYNNEHFNEKMDGIIYCVFSALGFAAVENIVYVVFKFTSNPHIGLYRGIFSVPAHGLFAVTMGYYLALAKFAEDEKEEKCCKRKALIMPMLLHGTFNFILMSKFHFGFLIFIPYVIYLWVINLRKLTKYYSASKIRYHNKFKFED